MPCPTSAGAAETANGAVERMVLLGLTGVYYTKIVWGAAARGSWCSVSSRVTLSPSALRTTGLVYPGSLNHIAGCA